MSAAHGLAVFVKTSELSPVKTRLATVIGAPAALAVWRGCLECVFECVQAVAARASVQPYWAVAEAGAGTYWSGWPVLVQPPGDLGTRMGGIHAQLRARHGSALLLGADAPALTPETLLAACVVLAQTPARVLAPAHDGGFVLYGSNVDHDGRGWSCVPYGDPDTAGRFLAAVGAGVPLTLLPVQRDLDTIEDARALAALAPQRPAQRRLWRLLREVA
ncbi:MAG: hypothetical protein AMXMBFR25_24940 [Lysobacterales bacterium]|nr:hypothetical protein [Xanthomonadales bacterium]